MGTVKMFGYLRDHGGGMKPHEALTLSDLAFAKAVHWTPYDWTDDHDWPCVAIGHITIERKAPEECATAQVTALRAKQREVLAAAQAASTEIDRQINELLAITNEVPA